MQTIQIIQTMTIIIIMVAQIEMETGEEPIGDVAILMEF